MEIRYTTLTYDLAEPVAYLINSCFPDMTDDDRYVPEDLELMADIFAEGSIVALLGGKQEVVVGFGTGIFTDLDWRNLPETESEVLGELCVKNHDPAGKFYYGSEFCVHPDFRCQKIGRNIYDRRKEVVVRNKKVGFFAASVLQGYVDYKSGIGIDEYFRKIENREIYDPTLSMQLRNGFQIVKPIQNFFDHPPSNHWSALIYWGNPEMGKTDFREI